MAALSTCASRASARPSACCTSSRGLLAPCFSARTARLVCAAMGRDEQPERPLAVFQAAPERGSNYTLLDVRDAVEACSPATDPDERAQCFLNFGLDAEAVDRYYDDVVKLEEALVDHPSEEDLLAQRMVRVAGFFLCLVVGYKVV